MHVTSSCKWPGRWQDHKRDCALSATHSLIVWPCHLLGCALCKLFVSSEKI